MIIRHESSQDVGPIQTLIEQAFEQSIYGYNNEGQIVNQLRCDNALTVSLVAEQNTQIIGHIAFSLVEISDGSTGWYGLGPMAVLPIKQKHGVGSKLVHEGLSELSKRGAKGCVVLGSPEYYNRFGFEVNHNLKFEGAPAEYFMCLALDKYMPRGHAQYHKAFYLE